MKKYIFLAIALLTFTGNAFSAPEPDDNDTQVEDRFLYPRNELDPAISLVDLILDKYDLTAAKVKEVIAYAKGFIGRPYSYGSKGPKSFDCSGFTSYVFKNFQILLNSSSQEQSRQGERISRKDIRPGDLLFFKGRNSNSGIGHVGLAIDVDENGEVSFIHASTSQGVRIDQLDSDPYYRSRYVCARRILE